jgi:hypothetical protein
VVFTAGGISDDCISDGGEFYDDDYDVEFSRPSEDVLLKSIPIVANQQVRFLCLTICNFDFYKVGSI